MINHLCLKTSFLLLRISTLEHSLKLRSRTKGPYFALNHVCGKAKHGKKAQKTDLANKSVDANNLPKKVELDNDKEKDRN